VRKEGRRKGGGKERGEGREEVKREGKVERRRQRIIGGVRKEEEK
jgi:hypothetical protein